jgi:hypothetical protein
LWDYTSQADRVTMLDGVEAGITALMTDTVEYPHAARYLLSPPISDIARPASHLLRIDQSRKWVDAFFTVERAGAHRLLEVKQPPLSWLADDESPMSITFEYEAEHTSGTHSAHTAK